ncbi:MAG: hypothetical protein QMD23_06480 [Candidatus Bathyarchaeia archaeon]|nr:hypothetical protein [Candidatus Bathyarchaeia archaeon]
MNLIEKKLKQSPERVVKKLLRILLVGFVVSLLWYTISPLWLLRLAYPPCSEALSDNGKSLSWRPSSWGRGKVGRPNIQNDTVAGKDGSVLRIQIENGSYAGAEIRCTFSLNQDWSSMNFLSFYLEGPSSGNVLVLIRAPDLENSWIFKITQVQSNSENLIYFNDFSINAGSPSWANVSDITIIWNSIGVWRIGSFSVGNDFIYSLQGNLSLIIKYLTIAVVVLYFATILKKFGRQFVLTVPA